MGHASAESRAVGSGRAVQVSPREVRVVSERSNGLRGRDGS
jgi:hypothetical protein